MNTSVSVFAPGHDPEAAALSTEQLIGALRSHSSHHLRGRAAAELSRRYGQFEDVFRALMDATVAPANRTARVLGLTTVSWLAAIAILENGTLEQVEEVRAILCGWDEVEKEALKYFLRGTGLQPHF